LGDSITAALGASSKSLLDLVTEFRGESWSIGGAPLSRHVACNFIRPDVRCITHGVGFMP
jgi:hypothetical protein